MKTAITAMVLAIGSTTAAVAADKPNTVPKDSCAGHVPPPPDMAAWTSPHDATAAHSEAELAQSTLTPGKAIIARLLPVSQVTYRVPPEKADGPATFGGLYALKITSGGTYRIVSSTAPWMDVFADRTPVKSSRFGHGPACTGIGKMVDFPLQAGDYLVQFSESLTPSMEIMVAPVTPNSVAPQR